MSGPGPGDRMRAAAVPCDVQLAATVAFGDPSAEGDWLLEAFDTKREAYERLDYWAALVVRMGLARSWGVRVDFMRTGHATACFGVYVRPRADPAP